jgi:hypothetical protein
MGLLVILLRAVLALLTVVIMTFVIYPLTAVWIFLFILRDDRSHHCLWSVVRNVFLHSHDVKITRD